jgi:hypothetical protein
LRGTKLANDEQTMIPEISGLRHASCLGYWDNQRSSWKMLQGSLFVMDQSQHTLGHSLVTLPKMGMSSGGYMYELKMSAHPTGASDSSCWPTHQTVSSSNQQETWATLAANPFEMTTEAWEARRDRNLMKGYNGNGQGRSLDYEAKSWATPTRIASPKSGSHYGLKYGPSIAEQAANWGTPLARDAKEGQWHTVPENGYLSRQAPKLVNNGGIPSNNTHSLRLQLNPLFVEWLMGYEMGWTSIDEDDFSL